MEVRTGPKKIIFSAIFLYDGFEHSNWLKNFEQPIKILKNNMA